MLPIYRAIAHAGLYVFLHAQAAFFVFLVLAVLLLWALKPWRMKATAATVILTPLIVLYAILLLGAIIPPLREQGSAYPEWTSAAIMITLLAFLPAGFYHLLSRLDKDRKAATDHPWVDKVLDYIGTAFFLGFVLVTGFGSFGHMAPGGASLTWHGVTVACLFVAGFVIFLRLVLGAWLMTTRTDNPYLPMLKRLAPWLVYVFLGATVLALVSRGLESL